MALSHVALFIAALVAVVCAFAPSLGDLKYDRVRLVDVINVKGKQQFLFRGNFPANDTSFEYETLLDFMSKRAEEAGYLFPNDTYIYDVTLNNPVDQKRPELEFWADPDNADKGELLQWPLTSSSVLRPNMVADEAERTRLALEGVWELDPVPQHIERVREILESPTSGPDGKSSIVFVHCSAGCDRTGAFIAGYRLKYQSEGMGPETIQSFFDTNIEICGRVPNYFGVAATEWLCLYNSLISKRDLGDCINVANCKPFGNCKKI